jgi:hypothetical protein
MRLKFFTLAVSLSVFNYCAWAQMPTPLPKVGYIRLWDMLPPANGSFQLCKIGGHGDVLCSASAYRYSSYLGLPVGQYQLSILKSGNEAPLKTLSLDLKADTYFTIILSPTGASYRVEFLDDTFDPQKSDGAITIRNYFPGTSISVMSGSQTLASNLAYGNSQAVTGLTVKKLPITIQTKLPDGKPAQAAADLDFSIGKHITVLVIPDSYGRFRVRATPDARNP